MAGPTQAVDMTGKKFGHLTVLRRDGQYPGTKLAAWLCHCNLCGREKTLCGAYIRAGNTTSCCGNRVGHRKTHGKSGTLIYAVWSGMMARCLNPKNRSYHRYGGRGIKVCERWRKFENFIADMGKRPSPKHTLERKDNNGHYEPGNCRWATRKEQANNTRRNVFYDTPQGRLSIVQIAKITGVGYPAILVRVKMGYRGADLIAPNKRPRRSMTLSTAARAAASR